MYFLDQQRGQNGRHIYKVKGKFDYPLQKNQDGSFKIKSGEMLRVCMTSDFFLEEADAWRPAAWEIIAKRPDVVFFLLTKRPERVLQCLPPNWGTGWEHVFFNITIENQQRADERVPLLLQLPFKHKGLMAAPFIGPISIDPYLKTGLIEQVIAGGENYDGARPLRFEWVQNLYKECVSHKVNFCFFETGTHFIKNNRTYRISDKRKQSLYAYQSGLQFENKPIDFKLQPQQANLWADIPAIHEKYWDEPCKTCAAKMICNGCQKCKHCSFL